MDQLTLPRTGEMTRLYYVWADPAKHPRPIRDVIAEAVDACRARNPAARPDVLLLHPDWLPVLGTVIHAGGQTFLGSYNALIDRRQVRVGPVD